MTFKSSHEKCDGVISSPHRAGTQAAVWVQTQVLTLNFGKFFQLSVQFICGGENTPTSQIYVFRKNEDHRAYLACSNSSVTVEVFLMFTAV